MNELMSIGKAAQELRITKSMLRRYASLGLIKTTRGCVRGWRKFSREEVERFKELLGRINE